MPEFEGAAFKPTIPGVETTFVTDDVGVLNGTNPESTEMRQKQYLLKSPFEKNIKLNKKLGHSSVIFAFMLS